MSGNKFWGSIGSVHGFILQTFMSMHPMAVAGERVNYIVRLLYQTSLVQGANFRKMSVLSVNSWNINP